jgi:aminomethyltransferase
MLRGTPFHARTAALCENQNWRNWSGYLVAGSYDSTPEYEYHAIRTTAALIDISPLFKYEIRGVDAPAFLNRISTRDIARCAAGQALYTCFCDERGHVIQDGTVFRLAENLFRVHLAEPSLRWFKLNSPGFDIEIADLSERVAALALQGPASRAILSRFAEGLSTLGFFKLTETQIGGVPLLVSRTGYTGDLGYELWLPAEEAESLWDLLIEEGRPLGLKAAGMLALDLARLEAGFILLEVDYVSAERALIPSQRYTPYELGLGWTVNINKAEFVGRSALLAAKEAAAARRMIGLEIDWQSFERPYQEIGLAPEVPAAPWRGGVPVYAGRRQVGKATTGGWSPTLKRYIALATVQRDYTAPGSRLLLEATVEHERKAVDARVVKTPFFNPPRKRA